MAVALEVGWGSGELGGIARMSKKRAWGDDQQKLLEMMLGKPFDESGVGRHHTLDLLGGRGASNTTMTTDGEEQQSDFLELGQDVPLPKGWEKRLDLKSGTVFFINWNTGKTTCNDPREGHSCSPAEPPFESPPAASCHMSLELLQSELGKQAAAVKRKNGGEATQLWRRKKQGDDGDDAAANADHPNPIYKEDRENESESGGLDLKLNLSSNQEEDASSVVTTTSSECLCLLPPAASSPRSSPSPPPSQPAKVTLTGCKRCLMYVMISQLDPRCPKCGSSVIMDFPVPKKQRKFDLEL
ncbi:uncharacterized protein LOC112342109 [Selaginella moellendorffii]|uniref:uncharacterized protein LOC112342109 n=1 Tax=Selaginella moellendorffii TaxID=88036 RepID=UPI000D1CC3A7|nr:uncharacterized protein LOC112342109 [Selaginella moellendorffii]XP_024519150.1 uncharacterized protein LOC112342109 [Selaginella moellendorffii]|eukprot:XP_024519149.1 uncharacterized protein LOC112342109 [Selaginella moellendorffii]